MKTLIIETIDPKKIGELVTASRQFCDTPDIIAVGNGQVPGMFGSAWQSGDINAANLLPGVLSIITRGEYDIILMSVSTLGTGLAGPLGAALSAPVITEVTSIHPDLVVDRPLYGGKAMLTQKIEASPAILTIRRKYFEPALLEGTTRSTPFNSEGGKVRLSGDNKEQVEGIPLEDAEVIVSGGRGIGGPDNFEMLLNLAEQMKGAVGASRGAVDEGWTSPTKQIGQTGKIVAPGVYFAVGISGASQHLAGIANSKCVVAINKDEEANIFNRARFGVVCDYKKFVPILTRLLAEAK